MQAAPTPAEIETVIQRPWVALAAAAEMPFLEVRAHIARLFQHIRNDRRVKI